MSLMSERRIETEANIRKCHEPNEKSKSAVLIVYHFSVRDDQNREFASAGSRSINNPEKFSKHFFSG